MQLPHRLQTAQRKDNKLHMGKARFFSEICCFFDGYCANILVITAFIPFKCALIMIHFFFFGKGEWLAKREFGDVSIAQVRAITSTMFKPKRVKFVLRCWKTANTRPFSFYSRLEIQYSGPRNIHAWVGVADICWDTIECLSEGVTECRGHFCTTAEE